MSSINFWGKKFARKHGDGLCQKVFGGVCKMKIVTYARSLSVKTRCKKFEQETIKC